MMKKLKYRAIDVKQLDWMKVGEQVRGGEKVRFYLVIGLFINRYEFGLAI